MNWQHVFERIAVNASYISTIFTAIKIFCFKPVGKTAQKSR